MQPTTAGPLVMCRLLGGGRKWLGGQFASSLRPMGSRWGAGPRKTFLSPLKRLGPRSLCPASCGLGADGRFNSTSAA